MKGLFSILLILLCAGHTHAQVLRHEYLEVEFDTTGVGFESPGQLGLLFFRELQTTRNLDRFFSSIEVFRYMIVHADMKHGQTALKAAEYYWREFEADRDRYCRQLLDNLDRLGFHMSDATVSDILHQAERVNDSDVMASDIEIIFDYEGDRYSILLDDCGKVRGKWFLMTPYVLWQGKAGDETGKSGRGP